jgi:hypothetical protein
VPFYVAEREPNANEALRSKASVRTKIGVLAHQAQGQQIFKPLCGLNASLGQFLK